MASANLDAAMTFTFGQEGDAQVSMISSDDGNWSGAREGDGTLIGTKYGISAPDLIAYMAPARVTAATMAAMPKSTAEIILSASYWQKMRCGDMPGGIDLSLNDHGFNAGDASSVKILQRLIGLSGDGIDGWAGAQTVSATLAFDPSSMAPELSRFALTQLQTHLKPIYGGAIDGVWGPMSKAAVEAAGDHTAVLCCLMFDRQLAAYEAMSKFGIFGRGWTSRCQARLVAALKLAA